LSYVTAEAWGDIDASTPVARYGVKRSEYFLAHFFC
jgi:hypothetical protein